MTSTVRRRPPAPSPETKAKSIAAYRAPARLAPASESELTGAITGQATGSVDATTPRFCHVHDTGGASVLLDENDPLVVTTATARGGDLPVLLELTDIAPVGLRERTRGLLWITGWLRLLPSKAARHRAIMIAEERPAAELLDVGHGARMACLHPSSLVLADSDGTHPLLPHQFAKAKPDPFCEYERYWLRHLEGEHPDVVTALARHVPAELRDGKIRPLSLDQYGLRLRVESDTGDHDVRLAFRKPAVTPQQLSDEMRRLVGCPFLAAHSAAPGG
ncbi:DUF2470 domain-containing protein [Haloechinothrix salitolerans]|uniref:DUF2470 domain-containing protein n=1 Tax=Haloechinothrix salitolerans TaxID=926830 RepID=A0ABW2BRE7_9PSEU